MNLKKILFIFTITMTNFISIGQEKSSKLTFAISVKKELKNTFKSDGRLLIYISKTAAFEPRFSSVYDGEGYIFGININNWLIDETKYLNGNDHWTQTSTWNLNKIPQREYFIQAVWVQNKEAESQINSPGNLYSLPIKIETKENQEIKIVLSEIIPERIVESHDLVELFSMKSDILSTWLGKSVNVKAAVLLPSGYKNNPKKKYPVRYNVGGYGDRYTRINDLIHNNEFMTWWSSKNAPQIITVFLDGEGPFGDSYQLDSENNGPYGEALIKEFIPTIEKQFRMSASAETRFVDGCSTGGWVSLALQIFYPDFFNGCWSYSPDPVSFKKMQLINIYEDENAFYNYRGYLRPSMRDVNGNPMFSVKQEIADENVLGMSNTFVNSGGQWGAWNALFSPKGQDGLPKPIFNPITGLIDKDVAEFWKKRDLLLYVSSNWKTLGPKIKGKIHIWVGDMDNFYLNNALRDFDEFLKNTNNPKSDAQIEFSPMKEHCAEYSHQLILNKIQETLNK